MLLFQAVQGAVAEEELGDEQLQQIYEDEILRFTTIEALHILVDTEAEAQDVYQQVTAPGATQKTFEDLAKDVSIDTQSGANGGEPRSGGGLERTCPSSGKPRSRSSPARSPSPCRASSAGT